MNNFNTKQRFSIRKYHIGAASVLLGAFIGLNTTSAQAAETETTTTSAVTTETKVTEQDIQTATDNVTVAQKNYQTAANNVATAQENLDNVVKTAPTQQDSAKLVEDAENDVTTAKSSVETATNKVSLAKDSDAANTQLKTSLEKQKADTNNKLEVANENLKNAAKVDGFILDANVNVSKEFKDALLKREQIMLQKPANQTESIFVKSGSEIGTNSDHTANHNTLKEEGKKNFEANTYTANAEDSKKVVKDLANLTESERKEINFFALDVLNKFRVQFGVAPLVPAQGMYDFTQEVVNNSKVQFSRGEKGLGSYDYKAINDAATKYGLYVYKLANGEEAQGQQDFTQIKPFEPTNQNEYKNVDQSGLMFTSPLPQEYKDRLKAIHPYLRYNFGLEQDDAKVDQIDLTRLYLPKPESADQVDLSEVKDPKTGAPHLMPDEAKTRSDVKQLLTEIWNLKPEITMGQLKEHVYDGIKKLVFTSGEDYFENKTNLPEQKRYWELALATVGKFYRQNMTYAGVGVTSRVEAYPTDSRNAKYKINHWRLSNLFLHINGIAPKNSPKTAENGEETNIAPDGFDLTPMKNDPDAAKKYQAAKAEVEKLQNSLNEITEKLNTAKKYVSNLPKAEDDLKTAKEKLESAKQKLIDAEKSANQATEDKKKYDANLKEASEKLAEVSKNANTAKEILEKTQKELADLLAKFNKQLIAPIENELPIGEIPPGDTGNNNGGDTGNNNGGDTGNNNGGDAGNNNGGDTGNNNGGDTGNNNGGDTGNNNGGDTGNNSGPLFQDPKQPLDPSELFPPRGGDAGNNGQVTPPSQGNYSGFNQPGKPLRNTGIVLPGVTGGQPANHKYNGRFEAPVSSKSTANALPKTSASTTNSATLPAGLAAALAAAGLLAAKRRKED